MTPVTAQIPDCGLFFPTNRDESLRHQNFPDVALLFTRQMRPPKAWQVKAESIRKLNRSRKEQPPEKGPLDGQAEEVPF